MSKKVLIVEDDKDFLWILRQNFEHQDFALSYALDGEQGFAMAQTEKPDLMVVDILLPNMDGIDMVKKLAERGIKPQIIFLTNLNDSDHISRALETAGQTDYFIKSDVHMDAIVERVKQKLGQ